MDLSLAGAEGSAPWASRGAGLAAGSHLFSPNQDHTFDLLGNLSLQALVTWEGDVLVCVQKGEKENRGWRQWVEGDKLYLVSPQSLPGSLPLCLHRLRVHLAKGFDKKNGPALLP